MLQGTSSHLPVTTSNACSLRKPRWPVPGMSIRQWQGDLFLFPVFLVLCASLLPDPWCLHKGVAVVAFRLQATQLDLHPPSSLPPVDPINQIKMSVHKIPGKSAWCSNPLPSGGNAGVFYHSGAVTGHGVSG